MREWFKYEFGYVNVEKETLYFTNSGNWTEIVDLEEKGNQIPFKDKIRKFRIKLYLAISLSVFGLLFFYNLISYKLSLILLILLPISAWFLYQNMKRETGMSFKVPFHKIKRVETDKANLTIIFLNGDNCEDQYDLINLDEKGINFLSQLNLIEKIKA